MIKHRLFQLAAVAFLLSASVAHAQVVATVNGVKIPQSRLNVLTNGQKLTAEQEKVAKETLINAEILSQAAKKKNLQQKPEVATTIELQTQQVLANAYINDYAQSVNVSDAELKKLYDENLAVLGDKEYKVSHILVGSESEAKAIIDQLKRGESFAKLAREKSLDKSSATSGGQLDWVPAAIFDDKIVNVPKGSYTQTPVRTPAGFHVVLVEDIRAYKKPTFQEARPQLLQIVKSQKVREHVAALRQQAKVQ